MAPGVLYGDPWRRDTESQHLPVKSFTCLMQQSPTKCPVVLQAEPQQVRARGRRRDTHSLNAPPAWGSEAVADIPHSTEVAEVAHVPGQREREHVDAGVAPRA